MTVRDLVWRLGGVALFVSACAIGQAGAAESGDAAGRGTILGLVGFGMAIMGVVLVAQGKRVATALRVERSGHRHLVGAIRARRRRRGAARQTLRF